MHCAPTFEEPVHRMAFCGIVVSKKRPEQFAARM